MNSVATKPKTARQGRKLVLGQLRKLREENIQDYLDVLDARVRSEGRPTYTTEQVRARRGLKPLWVSGGFVVVGAYRFSSGFHPSAPRRTFATVDSPASASLSFFTHFTRWPACAPGPVLPNSA